MESQNTASLTRSVSHYNSSTHGFTKALHTQFDLQTAQKQKADVQTTMRTSVADTIKHGDSSDVNVGWCI